MPIFIRLVEDPSIGLFARIVTGLILLTAGIAKIGRNRRQMVEVVRGFELLPEHTTRFVGIALPWVELVIACALLSGVFMPWSALAASSLFFLFGAAITINLLRGRRNIDCGCFGPSTQGHLTWALVVRNIALALLATLAMGLPTPLPDIVARMTVGETIATMLVVGAVLALWWLGHILVTFWQLAESSPSRLPDQRSTVERR